MLFDCCKCKEDKKDEAKEESELIVDHRQPFLPTTPSTADVASNDMGDGDRSPDTEFERNTKLKLKEITMSVWRQGYRGIETTAYINGKLGVRWPCVLKIHPDLSVSIARGGRESPTSSTTVLQFSLREVAKLVEGPNIEGRRLQNPIGSADDQLSERTANSVLERTLQFVLRPTQGNVNNICIVCESITARRRLHSAFCVLKNI